MSGIAGIVHFDGAPVELGLIEKMTSAMSYRGPDGINHWQKGSVALGQCMLRTTPESLQEVQPWQSEDGRYILVMDGRLDNWEELRKRLESEGCRLRNDSDAELVIKAFELWDTQFLQYIEGDFAFVVWDNIEKKIQCVRDRMGNRPFHYHWNGRTLAFASDLHAILALPWVNEICNEGMLVDYLLAHWCTSNETHWKEVHRLPIAHRMEISREIFKKEKYWYPENLKPLNFSSDEEYIEHYKALFNEAIRRSSRSHRTLAYEVSGGLDSSALFAVASHQQKTGNALCPGIDGYTLSFDFENDANELEYARAVGSHLEREIDEIEPSQPSLEWHDRWAKKFRELPPYPNSAMGLGIREKARQMGSKALVVGVGGDDWLGADRTYYAEELLARQWRAMYSCLSADCRDFGPAKTFWWLLRHGVAPILPKRLKKLLHGIYTRPNPLGRTNISWLNPDFQSLAIQGRIESNYEQKLNIRRHSQKAKYKMLHLPINIIGRDSEERLAAAAGIEIRRPYLNLQLVEFAFMSPDRIRLRGRTDKFVHRRAMAGFLPALVLNRETKADFTVTFQRYLSQMEGVLTVDIPIRRKAWVNAGKVTEMYQSVKIAPDPFGDAEWQLWGLFGCDAVYM